MRLRPGRRLWQPFIAAVGRAPTHPQESSFALYAPSCCPRSRHSRGEPSSACTEGWLLPAPLKTARATKHLRKRKPRENFSRESIIIHAIYLLTLLLLKEKLQVTKSKRPNCSFLKLLALFEWRDFTVSVHQRICKTYYRNPQVTKYTLQQDAYLNIITINILLS